MSFRDIAFEPKPVQKPHPAIWIAGDADAALQRAARFATGWMPFVTAPEQLPARIDFIKSQPTYDGRPFEVCFAPSATRFGAEHEPIDSAWGQPDSSARELVDQLGQLKEWGVTTTSVPIPPVRDVDGYLECCRWVIEEIKPKI